MQARHGGHLMSSPGTRDKSVLGAEKQIDLPSAHFFQQPEVTANSPSGSMCRCASLKSLLWPNLENWLSSLGNFLGSMYVKGYPAGRSSVALAKCHPGTRAGESERLLRLALTYHEMRGFLCTTPPSPAGLPWPVRTSLVAALS